MSDEPEHLGTVVSRALAAAWAAQRERSARTGICIGCGTRWAQCGPVLWCDSRKCCPDCSHVAEAPQDETLLRTQLTELREAALTLCEWASAVREHVDGADDPSTDDYAVCQNLFDAEYAVRGLLPKVKP